MSDGPVLEGIHRMLEAPSPKVRELGEKALSEMREADVLIGLLDPRLSLAALLHFSLLSSQRSRPDWAQALSENPSFPAGGRDLLARAMARPAAAPEPAPACPPAAHPGGEAEVAVPPAAEEAPEPADEDGLAEEDLVECGEADEGKRLSTYQRIQKMGAGQKIKLAMKGNKEARGILIKDSNREVYMSVLENPGMKEAEVEVIAKNAGTNKEILRAISKNKDWMANGAVMRSLVNNPKTPVEVANRYLGHLTDRELDMIEKSKSLPSLLRTNAKRVLMARKKKKD